jgi:hypothetical protein
MKEDRTRYKEEVNKIDALQIATYLMAFSGTTKRAKENIEIISNATKERPTPGGIYMMIHPRSRHRYIGQTADFNRRRREHYTGLKNEIKNKPNEMKRLYKQMNRTPDSGQWMFIIVKHDEKNYIHNERYKSSVERKRMEKHYITKLRPTLNYLERYTTERITEKKKKRRSNKRKNKRKNSNRIADSVTAMDTITESREFTIFEVVKTKRRYTTLNSVINLYPKDEKFKIKIRKGLRDITNYRSDHQSCIRHIQKIVQTMNVGEKQVIKMKEREDDEVPTKKVQQLLQKTATELWTLKTKKLETIWKNRKTKWKTEKEGNVIKPKETKKTLKKIIRTRYGIGIGETKYIGIPYLPSKIQQRRLQTIVNREWTDAHKNFPKFIIKTVKRRYHIKKNKTIGEELINMRKHAKNYGEKPKCKCDHEIFQNQKKRNDHQIIRASEIKNSDYNDIKYLHFQTVAQPATIEIIKDTIEIIRKIRIKASEDKSLDNKKWKRKKKKLHTELRSKIFIKTRPNTMQKIPHNRRIQQIKRKLKGLVITNMDRHRGEVTIECPCRHHNNLKKMYESEENAEYTENEIKKKFRREYKWEKIIKINEKSALPGPVYIMNKEKDITRQRPVRPSFKASNKNLLNITARVINFWINNAKLKTRNWHISNVLNLRTHWEKEKSRISVYGKDTRFMFKPGDIKDFFTTCEHREAIKAVRYIKDRYNGITDLYRVRKRGRNGVVNTTRGTLGDRRYTIVSGTEVMEILQYALENQFYKLGSKIKQQKIGFPMGEAIAPPGANGIATAAMEKWANQHPNKFKITTILRFVDDMISVVAYNAKDDTTKIIAKQILDQLYTDKKENENGIFKTPIRIVDEPLNKNGSTNFLEVEINTTKNCDDLTIRYKHKNEEHFKHGKKRKLKLIVPYNSWGPKDRQKAKLIGKFLRIDILTGESKTESKDRRLTRGVLPHIEECIKHGYPPKIIVDCIDKMKTKDRQWRKLQKRVTLACYFHHPYGKRLALPKQLRTKHRQKHKNIINHFKHNPNWENGTQHQGNK